jgi:hypothetical protein
MNNYWQVTVKYSVENIDTGKIQKITEKYLVKGISPSDVETKMYKEFEGENQIRVTNVSQTKFIKVIEDEK